MSKAQRLLILAFDLWNLENYRNVMICSLGHYQDLQEPSLKAVDKFCSYFADRQANAGCHEITWKWPFAGHEGSPSYDKGRSFICYLCQVSFCSRLCKRARGLPLWHAGQLPGQITLNAQIEDGDSQGHLEEPGGSQNATTWKIKIKMWVNPLRFHQISLNIPPPLTACLRPLI